MKRGVGMLLIAAVLLLLMSSAAFAANGDTLQISADSVTVKAGEVAEIVLTVEENPGFAGIVFTPVIKDQNGTKLNWSLTAELERVWPFDLDVGSNIILTSDDNCTDTGVLMTVLIYVPQNVKPGTYAVTFTAGECLSWTPEFDLKEVPVTTPTAIITVTSTSATGCAHKNTTDVEEKLPNCTEGGYTEGVFCNDCLEYVRGHQTIDPIGHTYQQTEDKRSCSEAGYVTYTCSVCGHTYSNLVEALGHIFTTYVSNNDATCTDDGTETAQCDYCEASFTRTDENSALGHKEAIKPGYAATCTDEGLSDGKYCSVCNEVLEEQVKISAGNHSFGEWKQTKAATCTEQGQQTRSCDACGETETETIEQLPHGVAVLEAKEPDCVTPGLTEGIYCPGCQLVHTAQEEIPAIGHSFGQWTVKTQATTETEGEEVRICANCGEEESRSIDKLIDDNSPEPKQETIIIVVVVPVALLAVVLAVVILLKKKKA